MSKPIRARLPLSKTHPKLAKEAVGWDPKQITSGSSRTLEWVCSKGHIWSAKTKDRIRDGSGCPYCSNKKLLLGFNDLRTLNPEIAQEMREANPKKVLGASKKIYLWECSKGHFWRTSVVSRTKLKTLCPYCKNRKVLENFNDLKTTHPKLAAELVKAEDSKNTFGSGKKVKWICDEGHVYIARISHRTTNQSGCPKCMNSGFTQTEPGWLYLIFHEALAMKKIGITNFPNARINEHRKFGWELIEIRGPMDGLLTQQWETAILRMLKAKGADLANSKIAGKFDGYSEAWSKAKFDVNSIKELMKLTEDFEESQIKTKRARGKTK